MSAENKAMRKRTVYNKVGLHQRVILLVMLVLVQFYSFGSDFFPDEMTTSSTEMIDQGNPDVSLDFDDNVSLRTVRQEQMQIKALGFDLIADLFTVNDLHDLMHTLEFRQCATIPFYYHLHKAQNFVWFCTFLI